MRFENTFRRWERRRCRSKWSKGKNDDL